MLGAHEPDDATNITKGLPPVIISSTEITNDRKEQKLRQGP